MRCTRTVLPMVMFVMSCGVMRMYCFRSDALAVSICRGGVSTGRCYWHGKRETHHHPHTDTTVDGVHEDVELV